MSAEDIEFWEEHGDEIQAQTGHHNPLADRPVLLPSNGPAWECFCWLSRWSNGMGGFSRVDLETYFADTFPGAWMDEEMKNLVIGRVEHLIDEDRRIQRERRKEQEEAAKSKHGA